jgi:hypothetical protein
MYIPHVHFVVCAGHSQVIPVNQQISGVRRVRVTLHLCRLVHSRYLLEQRLADLDPDTAFLSDRSTVFLRDNTVSHWLCQIVESLQRARQTKVRIVKYALIEDYR